MRDWLNRKSKGFYATIVAFISMCIGTICFYILTLSSFESSENPSLVFILSVLTMVACLVTAWKDMFKIPSLISFVFATITFFVFVSGRISYVAFFLSGDVMGTGMSPYFVVSTILFLIALILTILAMTMKQEKENYFGGIRVNE